MTKIMFSKPFIADVIARYKSINNLQEVDFDDIEYINFLCLVVAEYWLGMYDVAINEEGGESLPIRVGRDKKTISVCSQIGLYEDVNSCSTPLCDHPDYHLFLLVESNQLSVQNTVESYSSVYIIGAIEGSYGLINIDKSDLIKPLEFIDALIKPS